jgi:hypothetical protein
MLLASAVLCNTAIGVLLFELGRVLKNSRNLKNFRENNSSKIDSRVTNRPARQRGMAASLRCLLYAGLLGLCLASFSLVGMDGKLQMGAKVSSYLAFKGVEADARFDTTGVIDCTGVNDCSFLNPVMGTSLQSNKLGTSSQHR